MVGKCRCDGKGCRLGDECCATRREGRRNCWSQGACYGCTGSIGTAKADNKCRKAVAKQEAREAISKCSDLEIQVKLHKQEAQRAQQRLEELERGAGGVVPRFHDTTHFLAQMYVESILSLTPNPRS